MAEVGSSVHVARKSAQELFVWSGNKPKQWHVRFILIYQSRLVRINAKIENDENVKIKRKKVYPAFTNLIADGIKD